MKKTLLSLALLSLVTIACQKKEISTPDFITFAASLEQVESKATFEDGTAKLLWSDYDNLAVYSYSSAEVTAGKLGSALANIQTGVGEANATFAAPASINLAEGDNYFYAVYPAASVFDENRGALTVAVPAAQDGEFGKYQFCYAAAPAQATKAAIMDGTIPTFASFNPATSVVRVYPKLDDAFAEDSVELSTFSMTVEGAVIAGSASLNVATGAMEATGSEHTVTVTLASPITVTKSKGAYIDLVVIPASGFSSVQFATSGYSIDAKAAPANGFRAGKRLEVGVVMKSNAPMISREFEDYVFDVRGGDTYTKRFEVLNCEDKDWSVSYYNKFCGGEPGYCTITPDATGFTVKCRASRFASKGPITLKLLIGGTLVDEMRVYQEGWFYNTSGSNNIMDPTTGNIKLVAGKTDDPYGTALQFRHQFRSGKLDLRFSNNGVTDAYFRLQSWTSGEVFNVDVWNSTLRASFNGGGNVNWAQKDYPIAITTSDVNALKIEILNTNNTTERVSCYLNNTSVGDQFSQWYKSGTNDVANKYNFSFQMLKLSSAASASYDITITEVQFVPWTW